MISLVPEGEEWRLDAVAGFTRCTPGKTVPCGKVCRTPKNCKKGGKGRASISKEAIQEYASARRSQRKPKDEKRSPLTSTEVTSIIQDAAAKRIMPRDLKRGQTVKFMQWGMIDGDGVIPVYEREAVITSISPSKVTFKPLHPNEGGQRPTSKLQIFSDGKIADGQFYESTAQPVLSHVLDRGRKAFSDLERLIQESASEESATKDRDWYFRASQRNADIRTARREIEIAEKTAQGLTRRDSLVIRIGNIHRKYQRAL